MTTIRDYQNADSAQRAADTARHLTSRTWRRRVGIAVGVVAGSVAVLVAFALFAASREQARLTEQFPAPGNLYDAAGVRLHIRCAGSGTPTIVLESGLGDSSLVWEKVYDDLSRMSRVCAYDRAGLGWSDPSADEPTVQRVAQRLHALLQAAGEDGPFVLVGHSLGGIYVRGFAHYYYDEVVGLVLVDSSHPEQLERLPLAPQPSGAPTPSELVQQAHDTADLADVGLLALIRPQITTPPAMDPATQEAYRALALIDGSVFDAIASEMALDSESLAFARDNFAALGDIPLVVVAAGRTDVPQGVAVLGDQARRYTAAWHALQAELADLSTNGRIVVADDSGHYVQLEQPKLVVTSIGDVLARSRGNCARARALDSSLLPPAPALSSAPDVHRGTLPASYSETTACTRSPNSELTEDA